MSSGQEWQFHIATNILWSRLAISHCYWYLVVKDGNFTLLLTSSGQEWQLADLLADLPPTDLSVDLNGNFRCLTLEFI